MIKKTFLAVINFLSLVIIAAAIAVLCMVVFTPSGKTPNIAGYSFLRITTGSMEPTYGVDTMIVVKKTEPSEIKIGDVISFYSSDPALDGAVNTHRVTAVRREGDQWVYTTRGDANNVDETYEAYSRYLVGKVVGSSVLVGKLSRLAANPLIFIPIILIPLALILIGNLVRTLRLAGKIAKEEEAKAVQEAIRELREKQAARQKAVSDERNEAEAFSGLSEADSSENSGEK